MRLPGGSLPPFFSLTRRRLLFDRAQTANFGIGFDKLASELLKLAKLRYLSLCLAHCSWRRQRLGDRLAVHFVREPEVGAMPRFAGPMTATFRLAAPARSACDGTRTKVAELTELMTDCLASMLPFGKSLSHKSGLPFPIRIVYARSSGPKKRLRYDPPLPCRPPKSLPHVGNGMPREPSQRARNSLFGGAPTGQVVRFLAPAARRLSHCQTRPGFHQRLKSWPSSLDRRTPGFSNFGRKYLAFCLAKRRRLGSLSSLPDAERHLGRRG